MSTKLPIVKVKILEKVLYYMGFEIKRKKGSHVFIDILMVITQLFHIMEIKILSDI